MAIIPRALSVMDNLNVYLTSNGLKPASRVSFRFKSNQAYNQPGPRIASEQFAIYVQQMPREDTALIQRDLRTFESYLSDLDLYFKHDSSFADRMNNAKDNSRTFITVVQQIAKDQESLDALVDAESYVEEGLALGFPEESVHAFGKMIDGRIRNYSYLRDNIQQTLAAGMKVPSWLAYISFIPDQIDIVGGDISPSAESVGMRYQEYVRKNNFVMARIVEEKFKSELE